MSEVHLMNMPNVPNAAMMYSMYITNGFEINDKTFKNDTSPIPVLKLGSHVVSIDKILVLFHYWLI